MARFTFLVHNISTHLEVQKHYIFVVQFDVFIILNLLHSSNIDYIVFYFNFIVT